MLKLASMPGSNPDRTRGHGRKVTKLGVSAGCDKSYLGVESQQVGPVETPHLGASCPCSRVVLEFPCRGARHAAARRRTRFWVTRDRDDASTAQVGVSASTVTAAWRAPGRAPVGATCPSAASSHTSTPAVSRAAATATSGRKRLIIMERPITKVDRLHISAARYRRALGHCRTHSESRSTTATLRCPFGRHFLQCLVTSANKHNGTPRPERLHEDLEHDIDRRPRRQP